MNRFLDSARTVVALAALAGSMLLGTAAQADVPSGSPVDGIRCDTMEGAVFHIHQHVAVFDHGKSVQLPSDIGRPITAQCLYWLHTHTDDGIIHVESPVYRTFTLGQLFDVWGQPLSVTHVASAKIGKGQLRAYVNGELYKGDPRKIELAQHTDIVLEAGPPYQKPTPFTDWKGQ